MKFKFFHDPSKKTLEIPRPALQMSNLATAEVLTIHTERGFVLMARDDLSTAEAVGIVKLLTDISENLLDQLADSSQDAADELDDGEDERVYPLAVGNSLLAEAGISTRCNLDVDARDGRIVITGREVDENDPLLRYDDEFLSMLSAYEVDLDGLRFLLESECVDDE